MMDDEELAWCAEGDRGESDHRSTGAGGGQMVRRTLGQAKGSAEEIRSAPTSQRSAVAAGYDGRVIGAVQP